ncbi:MAG TPA: ribonucleotide-diphosphate reductase subunit alpha, partial [archaeon]|nr:ribonucleotide-diphosphate reductase subunit alpha [archaeon]
RNVLEGTQLLETNWVFEKTAEEKDFYSKDLMERVAKSGSVQNTKEIPEDIRKVFITALEIPPEWHIKMQAAFQKYCDSGISKTVNLPHKATPADIKKIYFLAWRMKCKTICIYRYGSKSQQVLYIGEVKTRKPMKKAVIVESEYSPDCPSGTCPT